MSNKSYGLSKERELRKRFEAQGYWVVPAKGSLGTFDGIAFNETESILFQVKATKQQYYSYKKEIEEIEKFKKHPQGWKKQLWIYLAPNKKRKERGWIKREIK